jgi:hypothetical protein
MTHSRSKVADRFAACQAVSRVRIRPIAVDLGGARRVRCVPNPDKRGLAVEGRPRPGAVIVRIAFRPRRHTGRKLVTVRPAASRLK